MLGTGSRFAEYGITGGFFLFIHILVFGWAFPGTLVNSTDSLNSLLSGAIGRIPPVAQPAFQSFLVGLALLGIFITGLFLDMMGSLLVVWEAGVFRKHLVKNAHWLDKLIDSELRDYKDDYVLFLRLSRKLEASEQWQEARQSLAFWRKGHLNAAMKRPDGILWQRKMQQAFRRLEFLFIARILSSGSKTEFLAEQMSVCRMARAIDVALSLIAIESFSLIAMGPDQTWLFPRELVALVGLALVLSFTIFITVSAYSRFCSILFSLVYAGGSRASNSST